ncbi:MAG: hypothetical protein ACTSPM_02800 [Candidatus Heimdallarchaeota archaeon]
MSRLKYATIILLITLSLGINAFNLQPVTSLEATFTHSASFKVSESTAKDTPIEIFEVTGNGEFIAYFNWPGSVGAACSSAVINFWSYETLSDEDQSEFGNLGHLRILRCQESSGNISININASESVDYDFPLKFYFEVDNDQSLTSAIQDTLFLSLEYYQIDGGVTPTANISLEMPITIITGILAFAFFSVITRRKRK